MSHFLSIYHFLQKLDKMYFILFKQMNLNLSNTYFFRYDNFYLINKSNNWKLSMNIEYKFIFVLYRVQFYLIIVNYDFNMKNVGLNR